MNNNFFFLISICFFTFSCKTTEPQTIINIDNTNYPITVRKLSNNNISYLRIPRKIELVNKSKKEKSFKRIVYDYNSTPKNKSLSLILFEEKESRLSRISNNRKKNLSRNSNLKYVFYSRHFVDSSKTTQQHFKPYIEKMLSENKDTLHVGTVSEFKMKHKELFEKLTKGDSISIQFLEGKKLGERITVPVKW